MRARTEPLDADVPAFQIDDAVDPALGKQLEAAGMDAAEQSDPRTGSPRRRSNVVTKLMAKSISPFATAEAWAAPAPVAT